MPSPVSIKPLNNKSFKQFEMLEGEVIFDDAYFHLSCVTPENYHNAYDADENFTLFRADAIFTHRSKEYVVPVFAMQQKQVRNGRWTWRFRFQPDRTGSWRIRIRVLCWHPTSGTNEQPSAKRTSLRGGSTYYAHEFGFNESDYMKHPEAQRYFQVREGEQPGPLETPNQANGDNCNYFYRYQKVDGKYQRRPFFLVGMARPWNVLDRSWDNFLDWDTELFGAMSVAGCNLLYHWMAPWENQLVHQAQMEEWPDAHDQLQLPRDNPKLSTTEASKGYKRYDQGRALLTDHILAKSQEHEVLTLLSVMSHQSLQDANHGWQETGWSDKPPNNPRRRARWKKPESRRLNGFQLFPSPTAGTSLTIENFFQMSPPLDAFSKEPPDPSKSPSVPSWQRQLWKHFANFWRYVIARWTASPALAGWVLIDELEGVGTHDDFWWRNPRITGPWHNNLLKMLRGELTWHQERKSLPYTGDYLRHPITITTTYYDAPEDAISEDDAQVKIDRGGESSQHGNWSGTPASWLSSSHGSPEQLDFLSNHTYQYVPTWGTWPRSGPRVYQEVRYFTGWHLPNTPFHDPTEPRQYGHENINVDRWFYDALCMRLHNWFQANTSILKPKLVTEYGSIERDRPDQPWNYYGPRSPSLTHFANWSSLMQGYAGLPLKWNDGKEFGEMLGRRSHSPWEPRPGRLYPVNCYVEMTSIVNFIKGVQLNDMKPKEEGMVVERHGRESADFHVWALADIVNHRLLLVWICDRTFKIKGSLPLFSRLKIGSSLPRSTVYTYTWFNTWDGRDVPGGIGRVFTDSKGILILPLPAFPLASDLPGRPRYTVSGADGYDIALRLVKVERT